MAASLQEESQAGSTGYIESQFGLYDYRDAWLGSWIWNMKARWSADAFETLQYQISLHNTRFDK